MKELPLEEISAAVEEIIFSLEDSINDKLNEKAVRFTSMDFKSVKHIIVKHLIARNQSEKFFCIHCETTIEGYPHACKGFFAPSPQTRYWMDDQASLPPNVVSSCMKGVLTHGSTKMG